MTKLLVIDFGTRFLPEIVSALKAVGADCDVLKAVEITDKSVAGYAGMVLSGSPVMLSEADLNEYEKYRCLFLAGIPVLGICFGHQLLGILNGSRIYKDKNINGNNHIELLKNSPIFNGLDKKCVFTEAHTEGIDVPAGFIHLAQSESYENEAMQHPSLPHFGVQFHPEVSGENGLKLFKNFYNICLAAKGA